MVWLPDNEKISKTSLFVLAQLTNVTDRHRVTAIAALCIASHGKQEAQLSLTNRAMLVCKVIEVWQDFLSEYIDKKFTYICYRRLIRHE